MQDRYETPIEIGNRIQDLLSGNIYTVTGIDELDSYVSTNEENGDEEGPYIYNTDIYYIVVESE